MNKVPVLTAKVHGTEDKMRIRFCLHSITAKMQDVITRFFELKWRKDVIVIRWPRNNVVEVRLSYGMIRSAGFLEVAQEIKHYWERFLQLVERQLKLREVAQQNIPTT